ncbi:MAG: hypothetical protein ABW168_23895 [Sedimenticola sp.]
MAKKKRIILKTILIVAEGFCDKAFVDYLKSLYIKRSCGVTVKVKNAMGKGSIHVVRHTIRIREGFDVKAAFYDTDVPLPDGHRKTANGKGIRLIESNPCLEGLLLDILGKYVPHCCAECKESFIPELAGKDPTEPDSYSIFTKDILEAKRGQVPELEQLLTLLEGE